ncbi:MAG: hypothetical protein ISP90_07835 [Nevskia sp.]|nr:hypothetical protein [Nevskia sp.]
MSLQNIVEDVKVRVGSLTAHSQKVAQISLDTIKHANGIVADKFQVLVKTETTAAKDLLSSARSALDKAKADGLRAVAAAPVGYLPPREKFVTVFNRTASVLGDTGDELYKTFKLGFATIQGELNGTPVSPRKAAAAARKRKPAAKRAPKTVKHAAPASAAKAAE